MTRQEKADNESEAISGLISDVVSPQKTYKKSESNMPSQIQIVKENNIGNFLQMPTGEDMEQFSEEKDNMEFMSIGEGSRANITNQDFLSFDGSQLNVPN